MWLHFDILVVMFYSRKDLNVLRLHEKLDKGKLNIISSYLIPVEV